MPLIILIRGGGDLASGVAFRLFQAGLKILITELEQPLAVRRLVSFSEAVHIGEVTIEGVSARFAAQFSDAIPMIESYYIPVMVDPEAHVVDHLYAINQDHRLVVIDGRMTKKPPILSLNSASFIVGIGPGFIPGENCHAAVETNRGHKMGRVIWHGSTQDDTGIPEKVGSQKKLRVLRSPTSGLLKTHAEICDHLEQGQRIASINRIMIHAPFNGTLRGILRSGTEVQKDLKIGDLDPRDDPELCGLISDKSLAVGGGVLEAILSRSELRSKLW